MTEFNDIIRKQLIDFLSVNLDIAEPYNHYYEDSYDNLCEDTDWYDDIAFACGADYCEHGASKIVLFYDKFPDWVVKIPFFGDYSETEDSYNDFEEANHYLPIEQSNDYCAAEAFLAQEAIKQGVSHMLACTYYLFSFNDIPIYVAERIGDDEEKEIQWKDKISSTNLAKDLKKCCYYEVDNCCLSDRDLAYFIDCYGQNDVLNLISFIDTWQINDLHGGNTKVDKNGNLKIIDYSGFSF